MPPYTAPKDIMMNFEGAHPNVQMGTVDPGDVSNDQVFNGQHIKIIDAASVGLDTWAGGTKLVQLTLIGGEGPRTPGRYVAEVFGKDALQTDFDVNPPQQFMAYQFDGQDYVFVQGIAIKTDIGWDAGNARPNLIVKIDYAHQDAWLGGVVAVNGASGGFLHGTDNPGFLMANNRAGLGQQFTPRPGDLFQPPLSDVRGYWSLSHGAGDSTNQDNTNNWALRLLSPNQTMFFFVRRRQRDYSVSVPGAAHLNQFGADDTDPGRLQVWAYTKAELNALGSIAAALAQQPIIDYTGPTNYWGTTGDATSYDALNPNSRAPAANQTPRYMRRRPYYLYAGMLYYQNGAAVTMPSTFRIYHTGVGVFQNINDAFASVMGGSTPSSAPTNTTRPSISGPNTQGGTLTGNDGSWNGTTPMTPVRHWYLCDASGNNPVAISGATAQTVVLTAGMVGKTLRYGVVMSNSAGTSPESLSDPTAVINGPPPLTWRQWVDSFNGPNEIDPGCALQIDPVQINEKRNMVTATIASGADNQDTASAVITDVTRLGTSTEGRIRFKLKTPSTFAPVQNLSILTLLNAAVVYAGGNNALIDLYITTARTIGWWTSAGILHSLSVNHTGSKVLVANTEYVIELAWKQNGSRQLWINDVLEFTDTALSGSTASAVPMKLTFGIDHYDATGTDPGLSSTLYDGQLSSSSTIALVEPTGFGALTRTPLAAGLFTNPAVKRKFKLNRGVGVVVLATLRKKVRKSFQAGLALQVFITKPKHKIGMVRSMAMTLTLTGGKFTQRPVAAVLSATAASVWKVKKPIASTLSLTGLQTVLKKARMKPSVAIPFELGMSQSANTPTRFRTFNLSVPTNTAISMKSTRHRAMVLALSLVSLMRQKRRRTLASSLVLTGALTRIKKARRTLAGGISFTSALIRRIRLPRARTMTLTPTLSRQRSTLRSFLVNQPNRVAIFKKSPRAFSRSLSLNPALIPASRVARLLEAVVQLVVATGLPGVGAKVKLNVSMGFFRFVTPIATSRIFHPRTISFQANVSVKKEHRRALNANAVLVAAMGTVFTIYRAASNTISLVGAKLKRG